MKISGYIILLFITFSMFGIPVYGRECINADTAAISNDTAQNKSSVHSIREFNSISEPDSKADDSVEYALLNTENNYFKKAVNRKALFHFLRSFKLKKASRDKRLAYKLYYRLAKVFVRMKIYPLAMQCYANTLPVSEEDSSQDDSSYNTTAQQTSFSLSSQKNNTRAQDSNDDEGHNTTGNILFLNYKYDNLSERDIDLLNNHNSNNDSEPVSNSNITESFNDGKKSIAYAMIIHVKQPLSGKRKPFTGLDNVGHMFITLIKYNIDSSCVYRSFGFYPQKDNLLSATPLFPVSSHVFKDDALHDWDEAIGKFISHKRFEKIIRLITHYENRDYHLNKNNCTDFGLYAAAVAGIAIKNTWGSWPLGSGNNPANAGQSILEGKFLNADTQNKQGLFICADLQKTNK